jgi:hypothetical protein
MKHCIDVYILAFFTTRKQLINYLFEKWNDYDISAQE